MKLLKALTVFALAISLAGAARALVVTFSGSNSPPVPGLGTVCISNLVGADVDTDNVDPTESHTYIAYDKDCPGQIFKTGSDANGYKLLQVSFRQPSYFGGFSSMAGFTYTVRIVKPASAAANFNSATGLTVIYTEGGYEVAYDTRNCDTCNFPDGAGGKITGTGRYITFTLDNPVHLDPNTLYGFDVSVTTAAGYYYEVDGYGPTNAYPDGVCYYTGANGAPSSSQNNLVGSRVFVASMVPGNVGIAPVFVNQPASGVWFPGGTAAFYSEIRGDTNLVYQWQKNGVNLSDGGNVSGSSTGILTITNVDASNAASYTLVVTNSSGSVTSSVATLSLTHRPTDGYAYVVYTNKPLAYWRLNEPNVNPATQPPTYDNFTGGIGYWGTNSFQTNGPRPLTFPGFETNNTANFSQANYTASRGTNQSWVTFTGIRTNIVNVTITGWIYPVTVPAKYTGLIFAGGGQAECGMVVSDSGGTVSWDWNDRRIRGNTETGLGIVSNQWQFVAMAVNSSGCTLYLGINGGALASHTDTPHTGPTPTPELVDGHWFAGYDPRFNGEFGFAPQYVLNGMVDEVAIFPSTLTTAQITALYNAALTTTIGPPVADFVANLTNGPAPLMVSFTNLSTGTITNYSWNFGDSQISTDTNPTHTYSSAGTYTVTLTAIGPGGTNVLTRTSYIVIVSSSSPVAGFAAGPTNGTAPLTVSFTNLSTGATNYAWTFGDGNTSTLTNPTNTYSNAGTYSVTLTAVGPGGTNALTLTNYIVVVAPSPPVASFTAGPTNGTAPLTVSFTNLSTGATNYAWTFGDGNTSALTNPVNTYSNAGIYSVTLTAVGPGGTNTLTITNYIAVAPAPPVVLTIREIGSNVVLSWPQGTLLEATNITGPWTSNNATSPYPVTPTAPSKFYRVIVQ